MDEKMTGRDDATHGCLLLALPIVGPFRGFSIVESLAVETSGDGYCIRRAKTLLAPTEHPLHCP